MLSCRPAGDKNFANWGLNVYFFQQYLLTMNEYPITPTYKIIGQLFGATVVIAGIYIINTSHTAVPSGRVPLIIMGTAILLLGCWLLYGATRLCLIVDDDAVKVRGALGSRELPLSEIDGYRYGDKGRFLLVRKNGRGFIIPDYIAQRDELIEWIKSRYGDVDARERAEETKIVLQDERYGATKEERKAALQKTRTIAWILNPISIVISFCLVFFQTVRPLLYIVYALPWVGIFLTWRSNDMIRLSVKKSTPHPSLLGMMAFPAFMLGIYAIRFDLYGFSAHAWTITSLTALVVVALALTTLRGTIALEKAKALVIVFLIVLAGFYGFGVVTSSNIAFDRSVPQMMHSTVLWKTVHHGKSTSYSLELSPWGRYTEGNKVTVSRDFFSYVRRGDTVDIPLYSGKWGIPWYRVTEPGY